jgi:hypothetical protein
MVKTAQLLREHAGGNTGRQRERGQTGTRGLGRECSSGAPGASAPARQPRLRTDEDWSATASPQRPAVSLNGNVLARNLRGKMRASPRLPGKGIGLTPNLMSRSNTDTSARVSGTLRKPPPVTGTVPIREKNSQLCATR